MPKASYSPRCFRRRPLWISSIPRPRSLNEGLVDTFGGDRLRPTFETEYAASPVEMIDSFLRATN